MVQSSFLMDFLTKEKRKIRYPEKHNTQFEKLNLNSGIKLFKREQSLYKEAKLSKRNLK